MFLREDQKTTSVGANHAGVGGQAHGECRSNQSGRVRGAPEEQCHQRDDQSVVRASDGERDHVESYMSKAWTEEASTRTRQQQCVKLSSDIVNMITVSDEANEIATLLGVRAQPKAHDVIIVCDVTDKESFNSVKDWTGEDRQACLRRCQQAPH